MKKEHVLVKNASDPQQVHEAEERSRDRQQSEIIDLRNILDLPSGRRFIWKLLERCRLFSTTFSNDPHASAFMEGERNIGLYVLGQLEGVDPNAFAFIYKEANQKEI